jgi:hypothetical protein
VPELTYRDAVDIVRAEYAPRWGGTPGTLFVSPTGYADPLDFLVPWGAEEYLVGGDTAFLLMNNLVTFVDRRTGALREETSSDPDVRAKIRGMDEASTE